MEQETIKKSRNLKVYIPLGIVVILVIVGTLFWYNEYAKYISTDDAHVESDKVAVSAKSLGRIHQLFAEEGDTVKAGMLLALLDSTDLIAQRSQASTAKAQAEAAKVQAEAKYRYDDESIKVYEVAYARASEDFQRAKEQFSGEVISKEQFDHLKKAYESAKAQLETAKTQLTVSKSQIGSAAAAIENAGAQINVIQTQLNNMRLYAPISGVIAKRWLLPGDVSQPGQAIYTITNNDKLWVTVYIEETKMEGIHIQQKVVFTIDAFPDVEFTGKVYAISSNTASQFSLIPANNASGNFTKVTQRVPLKVSIDAVSGVKKLSDYKILPGMSAVVKIVKD